MKNDDAQKLYKASSKRVDVVDVPEMVFLVADGRGEPNAQPFKDAVQRLYALSYTLKFGLEKAEGLEYKVSPLEGLWWLEDAADFDARQHRDRWNWIQQHRDGWSWTVLIRQPEAVTPEWLERAKDEVERKKGLRGLESVRLERYREGRAVQVLHLGPYSAEAETLAHLDDEMARRGYAMNGKHHEIYLSGPERTPPERWKTILRHPVRHA